MAKPPPTAFLRLIHVARRLLLQQGPMRPANDTEQDPVDAEDREASGERLRARMRLEGITSLGDADLLSLLLGSSSAPQIAAELLDASGGLVALAREGIADELAARCRLGDARRARIEAAIELGRRATVRASLREGASMAGPQNVAAWASAQLGALTHEEIWLLALDGRHGLRGVRRVASGGGCRCATSARDVLRVALCAGASSFVLVHNHPSGDPTPTGEDARMTRELARAAALVGLPMLDHVIVGGERHASLYELGLLS